MLIKRFVEYILRGRLQAIFMALLWSFVPLMGWLSMVTMSIVTMRKGALEGLVILPWTVLPGVIIAIHNQSLFPFIYSILAVSLVTWLLAIILRESASWSFLLQCATVLGLIVVLLAHVFVSDIHAYWTQILRDYYQTMQNDLRSLSNINMNTMVYYMASIATGMVTISVLIYNLINIGIARWMQSLTFYPEGFIKEVYRIRLGLFADAILILVIIGFLININIAWDLLPVVLLPFFMAGLSLVHAFVSRTRAMWLILISFYGLLIILFQFVAALIILLAFADTWFDFRNRLIQNAG